MQMAYVLGSSRLSKPSLNDTSFKLYDQCTQEGRHWIVYSIVFKVLLRFLKIRSTLVTFEESVYLFSTILQYQWSCKPGFSIIPKM